MDKRCHYRQISLPLLLVAPQLLITIIFFFWPAGEALRDAFYRGDAFGLHSHFVAWANFTSLFHDPVYLHACISTLIFSTCVTVLSLGSALWMAMFANRVIRGNGLYKSLLIWPYAVAPAVAGILWRFLFSPSVGVLAYQLQRMGYQWNYLLNGNQAMFLVVIAAAWQQFSYNFIFFLAGLQAIPKSLTEAAAIDGAGPWKRFLSIEFPLLSPTTFFLLVINMIYAFFQTFGVIQTVTQGGPADATNILVYKVYNDGFMGLNLGSSSAQSVLLMIVVIVLTVIQFRYIERKVHY